MDFTSTQRRARKADSGSSKNMTQLVTWVTNDSLKCIRTPMYLYSYKVQFEFEGALAFFFLARVQTVCPTILEAKIGITESFRSLLFALVPWLPGLSCQHYMWLGAGERDGMWLQVAAGGCWWLQVAHPLCVSLALGIFSCQPSASP